MRLVPHIGGKREIGKFLDVKTTVKGLRIEQK
jgi:hypothetical protein